MYTATDRPGSHGMNNRPCICQTTAFTTPVTVPPTTLFSNTSEDQKPRQNYTVDGTDASGLYWGKLNRAWQGNSGSILGT